MRSLTIMATIAIALTFAATDCASAAHAAGAVRGTKETITFEIVGKKKQTFAPNGYDGLDWDSVLVMGKKVTDDAGFQAVVQGKAAATFSGGGGTISISAGTFALKSGHFAAFNDSPEQLTITAYRKGVQVGELNQTINPADTLIRFDSTFTRIDTVTIEGGIAMDNLIVKF